LREGFLKEKNIYICQKYTPREPGSLEFIEQEEDLKIRLEKQEAKVRLRVSKLCLDSSRARL
jgi:hypothetical protein